MADAGGYAQLLQTLDMLAPPEQCRHMESFDWMMRVTDTCLPDFTLFLMCPCMLSASFCLWALAENPQAIIGGSSA